MARIELPSAADQTALDGNIFATVESGKACMLPERLAHSDGELLHAQARTPLEALCAIRMAGCIHNSTHLGFLAVVTLLNSEA
jgi:hypothetical protein